jgi:hypothetical protein
VSKLAAYRVAEKMNVVQAPPNNDAEFRTARRPAVPRQRARFAFYVRQPRAVVQKSTQ